MSRGTNTLGALFLTLGLGIAIAASVVMILAQAVNIAAAIALGIGVAVAILGALFIEPDATKQALGSLGAQVGPYLPFAKHDAHDDGAKGD